MLLGWSDDVSLDCVFVGSLAMLQLNCYDQYKACQTDPVVEMGNLSKEYHYVYQINQPQERPVTQRPQIRMIIIQQHDFRVYMYMPHVVVSLHFVYTLSAL